MLGVQSCSALRNCMDCSPLVSSVHGIFQARIQQVAITFCMYTYVYMKSKGIPFLFFLNKKGTRVAKTSQEFFCSL